MTQRKLNIHDGTKTSRGSFPVKNATVIENAVGHHNVSYTFSTDKTEAPHLGLEDFAGCLRSSRDTSSREEIFMRIEQFAKMSGPLFGQAAEEPIADWQIAIMAAQQALALQEQINGTREWQKRGSQSVVKTQIEDRITGRHLFTVFYCQLLVGLTDNGPYGQMLSHEPLAKTFNTNNGFDYLFIIPAKTNDRRVIDIHLIACDEELSTSLLALLLCYFNDQDVTGQTLASIGVGGLAGANLSKIQHDAEKLEAADAIVYREADITKVDAEKIQRIVQAIAALHLENVHIDLFKDDKTEDSLAFDSYLSSLWYDCAMQLGAIKFGYCQECGKGFSLTGHRGLPKQYCSDECRTKAKNRRERTKVMIIRQQFLSGTPIKEIVAAVFPTKSTKIASAEIAVTLSKWPVLKQQIVTELKQTGESPLLNRCIDEGVLSTTQVSQLRRRASRTKTQE